MGSPGEIRAGVGPCLCPECLAALDHLTQQRQVLRVVIGQVLQQPAAVVRSELERRIVAQVMVRRGFMAGF